MARAGAHSYLGARVVVAADRDLPIPAGGEDEAVQGLTGSVVQQALREADLPVHASRFQCGGETAAVSRHAYSEVVVPNETDLGPARIGILEQERDRLPCRFLAQRVAQIARAALGRIPCRPERLVELGRERVCGIRARAQPEQGQVLDGAGAVWPSITPGLVPEAALGRLPRRRCRIACPLRC